MQLSVLTSLSELERLEPFWQAVQHHPNTDLDHFGLVCKLRPEVLQPHVVLIAQGGEPTAMLVARVERARFSPAIGYSTPLQIPATVLRVLHQGALGLVREQEAKVLVRHLWELSRAGSVDLVELSHLVEHSALSKAFITEAPRLWTQKKVRWANHWSLTVPQEPGELRRRMRSKHRNWLRKKEREIDEAFPNRVCWRWVDRFEAIPTICAEIDAVAARTYQRGLGAGFQNDQEHRERLALFADRNQLRLQVLEIDGHVRAFWLGTVYRGVFHSWATAYDPDIRQHEPGNLMFHRMIDELAREGIQKLDFGLGDAFYKERFGDESWREATMRLFAPTAKGALLRCSAAFSSALDSAGRRVLTAVSGAERLKTRWRRQLTPGHRRPPGNDR